MNPKLKEYLISSANTFISAFLLALLAMPIDVEHLDKAMLFSITIACVRAGVRAVQQYIASRI